MASGCASGPHQGARRRAQKQLVSLSAVWLAVLGMSSADVLCFLQVPELNVQNGVLKALSFLFEYIGEMGKDYIYSVSPLLEDALMDRDLVRATLAMYASG